MHIICKILQYKLSVYKMNTSSVCQWYRVADRTGLQVVIILLQVISWGILPNLEQLWKGWPVKINTESSSAVDEMKTSRNKFISTVNKSRCGQEIWSVYCHVTVDIV